MAYINPNIKSVLLPGVVAQFGGAAVRMQAYPNNNSDNPDDWDTEEKVKFFLWFMKMHHEEDIKGFKAMRDIERSVEREEQLERERQMWELQNRAYQQQIAQAQAMQAQAAQNAYQYNATTLVTTQPTKKPLWKKLLAM